MLYNRAICSARLGSEEDSFLDINEARFCADTSDQKKIIERAARTGDVEQILFGLPSACIFVVPETKIRNMGSKKWLKEATLIRGSIDQGFSGGTILRNQKKREAEAGGFDFGSFESDLMEDVLNGM